MNADPPVGRCPSMPGDWRTRDLEFGIFRVLGSSQTGFDLHGDRIEPADTAFGYDVRGHSYSVTYDGPGFLDSLTAFLSI